MMVDPSGHMNFFQTDDLLNGITDGGLDMVKGIIASPKALFNLGKELISGDLSLKDIASMGIDSITSDYKYLYSNIGVLSPFSDVSDEDVRAYGSHMTSAMVDIAAVFTAGGAEAAKLTEVLSKSKSGQRLLETLGKVGNAELTITNDILGKPRVGSALKLDDYHAFSDIVDNYAGTATQTSLNSGAALYQVEGSLNGASGRFEWITQNGNVTHRMFVPGGTLNGVPIRP